MRVTRPLVQVALVLMADPAGRHWGYETGRKAHVRSGVLYPILRRMLDEGWLTDGWESHAEALGRPARRYYELTDRGRTELGGIVHDARSASRFADLFDLGAQGAM